MRMEREEGGEGEKEGRRYKNGGGWIREGGNEEESRVHLCELSLLSTFHFGCAVSVLMSPYFDRMPD